MGETKMKNSKFILFLTIIFINLMLVTGIVFSQSDWIVTEDRPPAIGPEVLAGERNNSIDPDATWVATEHGIAQAVVYDYDTKCTQKPGYVQVEMTVMPMPTPLFRPGGDCSDPIDYLWISKSFTVSQGNLVSIEQGETSGRFYLNFITATPTPSPTATAMPTPTNPPIPTATQTQEPPETVVPSQCVSVYPEKIGDGSYLIWVEAINPINYILFDGEGYLSFDEQPIPMEGLITGIVYTVFVGGSDIGCDFQLEPTGLPTDEQPRQLDFQLVLPFLSR
jgi:hypothetical protein